MEHSDQPTATQHAMQPDRGPLAKVHPHAHVPSGPDKGPATAPAKLSTTPEAVSAAPLLSDVEGAEASSPAAATADPHQQESPRPPPQPQLQPHQQQPQSDPHQEDMSLLARALDAGCSLLQPCRPIGRIHQHICAFHMYAQDATRPVKAHHFCSHRSGEMRQCVLYDSNDPDARLIGIEYIISRRLFEALPAEERKYWHSHMYEVTSGMLVAPGVPAVAEDADMRQVINTYGKIWHTWQVDRGDPLPLGPPQLMMAYTADGQLPPEVLAERDRELGVDSAQVRHRRRDMAAELPQPHPDADHPWRTGRAWQVAMQQVDFRRPQPGEVPLPQLPGGESAAFDSLNLQKQQLGGV